jgi:hypothetical protein
MASKNCSDPEFRPGATWGLHSSDENLRESLEKCRKNSMSEEVQAMSPVEYIEYVLRAHVLQNWKNPIKRIH